MEPACADTTQTIVALASAAGSSSRAIIRLSGPNVPALIDTLLIIDTLGSDSIHQRHITCAHIRLDPDGTPALSPRYGHEHEHPPLGHCHEHGHPQLPILALIMPGPTSYTGQNCAEFLIPGHPHLVRRVLDTIVATGLARLAQPGEFSARAYLNNRLRLDQAEGIAAAIAADSLEELSKARQLATGHIGSRYVAWADELLTMLALIEAGIDFTDQEDVVPITEAQLHSRLSVLVDEMAATNVLPSHREHQLTMPLVVLAGQTNAGKSTLFNAMLGYKRAVESHQPHATRDALLEPLDFAPVVGRSLTINLADAPGFIEQAPSEYEASAGYTQSIAPNARSLYRRAQVIVYCDPSGCFDLLDMLTSQAPSHQKIICVRTKADLPIQSGPSSKSPTSEDIALCALDHWHIDEFKCLIAQAIEECSQTSATSTILHRHAQSIALATTRLIELMQSLDPEAHWLKSPELRAQQLTNAIDALEEVIGKHTADDVIGTIFATFCVGK